MKWAREANLAGLRFHVQKQPLFTVRFRLVTSDGSAVPWRELRVAVVSPESHALAYREDDGVDEDGSCTLGLIPPGHYLVSTFIQPDVETERLSPEVSKWSMARQEVDISGDGEVVLRLVPASY
jgi:hypothetical protein